MSVNVFFSYAHRDEDLRDDLAKHLSILQRQGVITAWRDRDISAGANWAEEIDRHLLAAHIILLLISADFLASDYCYEWEMTQALERHNTGKARVIPVILRPVDWQGAPFGRLQALPKNAKAVTSWANQDEAFADVAQGIRKAAAELSRSEALQSPAVSTPSLTPETPPRESLPGIAESVGQPIAPLEVPEGQVRLESPFYMERPPIEADCYSEIIKTNALIRIKAPRQMGKSSLMARILAGGKCQN